MDKKWAERLPASGRAAELLVGAYDIHVHGNPSYGPGNEGFEPDDFTIIAEAREAGLKGVCIKNMEFTTIFRDYLVNQMEKKNGYGSCKYYSSMTLNAPVGGINPAAVDFAISYGTKCIWFPTYSSQWMELMFGWGTYEHCDPDNWFSAVRMRKPANGKGISIFNAEGRLIPEVYEIIDMTKQAGVCLATGHMSPKDSYALCKAGAEMGHRKMILTHPDNGITFMDKGMIRSLADMGVYIEKTFYSHVNDYNPERAFGHVREMGPEHFFLVSDTGQPEMLRPVDALKVIADDYLNHGFTEEEVRRMIQDVPGYLMEG